MASSRTRVLAWTLPTLALLAPPPRATAADEPAAAPRQWAILIGVSNYDEPTARRGVQFAADDARLMQQTLVRYGGVPEDNILLMTDDRSEGYRPRLDNLRREVPRFLKRIGKGDRVVVFFSGHGDLVGDKTYLAPADYNPKKRPENGWALEEVRKALATCPAAVKFLILDCCHAGGAKGPADFTPNPRAFSKELGLGAEAGYVTLASCQENEQSFQHPFARLGAFTFWLCRALEGAADVDGDGMISRGEVVAYARDRVAQTVRATQDGATQTPIAFGPAPDSTPVLLLRPKTPQLVCEQLAKLLDQEIREQKFTRVLVSDFGQPVRGALTLDRAPFPVAFAEKLRTLLRDLAIKEPSYEVIGHAEAKAIRVEEVERPGLVQRLHDDGGGGPDAVVVGQVFPLLDRGRVHVQCTLRDAADARIIVTPGGVIPLTPDLLAGFGANWGDYAPGAARVDRSHPVAALTALAAAPSPILDPSFPFPVEVWAVGADGKKVRKDVRELPAEKTGDGLPRRHVAVSVRRGDRIEIRVSNLWQKKVAMTLLVDGVNTLGEDNEWFGDAWSWVLEPRREPYVVDGWYEVMRPTGSSSPGGSSKRCVRSSSSPTRRRGSRTAAGSGNRSE